MQTTAPTLQSTHPTWFDIGEEKEYGNLTLESRSANAACLIESKPPDDSAFGPEKLIYCSLEAWQALTKS